jgi:hypothetical protein
MQSGEVVLGFERSHTTYEDWLHTRKQMVGDEEGGNLEGDTEEQRWQFWIWATASLESHLEQLWNSAIYSIGT